MSRTYRALAAGLSAVLIGITAMLFSAGTAGAAPAVAAPVTLPVTGTFTDASGGTGSFVGSLALTEFAADGDVVSAVGDLTGTLTDSTGAEVGTVNQPVAAPVDQVGTLATCEVLNLVLGPLDLDLLGLVVHLDRVVLDITAESGPGNLLGNLLCAVAGLLDGPGAGLGAILSNLLNQILALLGSLGG